MAFPEINMVADICYSHGITDAVISPGSRSAPLAISFKSHASINCHIIPDERSAAFIALGMAQASNRPVVLICTSGTAALNYYPAVAEGFYSDSKLLVFTADRPAEWIDQFDGQAIHQNNIYGDYVSGAWTFPTHLENSEERWHGERIINEAINRSEKHSKPVHVNFPFREPFYPNSENKLYQQPKIIKNYRAEIQEEKIEIESFENKKILFFPGQSFPTKKELAIVQNVIDTGKIVCVADITSNYSVLKGTILHQDLWVPTKGNKSFTPDVVITSGKSFLSKSLKLFLRDSDCEHWHITQNEDFPDTFKKLTKIYHCSVHSFFKAFSKRDSSCPESFIKSWRAKDKYTEEALKNFSEDHTNFGELYASINILDWCNKNEINHLHLGNSMPVRYANYSNNAMSATVYCNRGTSGIDGSVSTFLGCLTKNKSYNVGLFGDMSFLYDSNALWNGLDKSRAIIFILNNNGGGIFRMINGPSEQPHYEDIFEVKHGRNAANLAKDYEFDYLKVKNADDLNRILKLNPDNLSKTIIEVFSESKTNSKLLNDLKNTVKN